MPCLDTNILLDLMGKGGRKRTLDAHRALAKPPDPGSFATTRLNLAELYVGVELAADPVAESRLIKAATSGLVILEFEESAMRHFAIIRSYLHKLGRPSGEMDTLIAAIALANNQSLITRNVRHFTDIPGLIVESY